MVFSDIRMPSFDEIADFNFYYLKMKSKKDHLPEQSILVMWLTLLVRFFFQLLIDIKYGKFIYSFKHKHLFYSTTTNQLKALYDLYVKYPHTKCFYHSEYQKNLTERIPQSIPVFFSVLLFPIFLLHYLRCDDSTKRNVRRSKNDVVLSYGYYYFILLHFKKNRPSCIILTNDHLFQHRILMRLGAKFGVPSIYIQHAPVTSLFPPLEFDLSLLEGEISKNMYLKSGSYGQIELIGMLKFDRYYPLVRKRLETTNVIGISTNLIDDYEVVKQLIHIIIEEFPNHHVLFRLHPSLLTNRYKHIYKEIGKQILRIPGIGISNPTFENSFEYLRKIDVNIAGKSGIHLDSVLMNIPSIFFSPDGETDKQTFVENRMILAAYDLNQVLESIRYAFSQKEDVRLLGKKFVDTIDTRYDGKSLLLALKHIETFLKIEDEVRN